MTRVKLCQTENASELESSLNAAIACIARDGHGIKAITSQIDLAGLMWSALIVYGHGPTVMRRGGSRS